MRISRLARVFFGGIVITGMVGSVHAGSPRTGSGSSASGGGRVSGGNNQIWRGGYNGNRYVPGYSTNPKSGWNSWNYGAGNFWFRNGYIPPGRTTPMPNPPGNPQYFRR